MTKLWIILCLYYILFISSIFLHHYFSKFIASDFQYNRTLNIKRRWTLVYYYLSGVIYNAYTFNYIRNNDLGVLNDHIGIAFIIGSIFLIILWYCHIIYSLEVPKKSHKKRKWK